ncbi:hypothetical protein ACVWWN_007504 [Mycobacterium sp. URHB0021]
MSKKTAVNSLSDVLQGTLKYGMRLFMIDLVRRSFGRQGLHHALSTAYRNPDDAAAAVTCFPGEQTTAARADSDFVDHHAGAILETLSRCASINGDDADR